MISSLSIPIKEVVNLFDESKLIVNGLMRERDSPSPVSKPMSSDENEEEVDPYEALDVSTNAPAARGAELLDAFGEEEDALEEEGAVELAESSSLEIGETIELSGEFENSFITDEEIVEEEDDVDPFEELGASRPASINQEDPMVSDALAELMDDEDEEETEEAVVEEAEEEYQEEEAVVEDKPKADPEELYRFLLEGVWVDDVLDPAEVTLMAKKRRELNISFETHLKILREVLHE